MKLPVAAEYAIRGIVHIAKQGEHAPVTIKQIAEAELIPRNYLIKIFKSLVAAGLIRPYRGKKGGFSLAADPRTVTLRTIIEAVQGPIYFNECLMGPAHCAHDNWCPGHQLWQRVQKAVCEILDSATLDELAAGEGEHTRAGSAAAHKADPDA